jgi:hypothetical protein
MNRLIVAGATALFLVACSGESTSTPSGNTPASAAATSSQVKLELGKNI